MDQGGARAPPGALSSWAARRPAIIPKHGPGVESWCTVRIGSPWRRCGGRVEGALERCIGPVVPLNIGAGDSRLPQEEHLAGARGRGRDRERQHRGAERPAHVLASAREHHGAKEDDDGKSRTRAKRGDRHERQRDGQPREQGEKPRQERISAPK